MTAKIFRFIYPVFLFVMSLVGGGAAYQAVSIVPFWQRDLSMFKNYGHWGIDYFPILSPLMTVIWLVVVITGIKVQFPKKGILYASHFLFLLVVISTFTYFAPFLLNNMGNAGQGIPDQELAAMLDTWARWDIIRQITGCIAFGIFLYCYKNILRGQNINKELKQNVIIQNGIEPNQNRKVSLS